MAEGRGTYTDVCRGRPANGLIWTMEGGIRCDNPPTPDNFYTRDGRRFLRSSSWERMRSRQKDRPPLWYTPVYENTTYRETEDGECDVFSWETPAGTLIARRHQNHFVEYPVKSVDDLDAWLHVYEHLRFRPTESWFDRNDAGQVTTVSLNWSPVQQLLQFDTGLENFYYFLSDAPEKMIELLNTMQERCMDRLRLGMSLFEKAPIVYWGENTSSSSISPSYYREYSLGHVRQYAELVHENNKRLIVHMCGLLKALLDCFVLTGMDGIDSVTPPPIGDTPYGLIRERFRPDFTILGRLNAQLWVGKTKADIQAGVREMISAELLRSPFALLVTADAMGDIPYEDVMVLCDALESMRF